MTAGEIANLCIVERLDIRVWSWTHLLWHTCQQLYRTD